MLATRDGIKGVCCSFSFFEPASWKLRAVHATETVIRRGGSRLREGYARGRASSLRRRVQKGRGGMQDGDRGTKGPCKSSTSVTPAVPAPERRARGPRYLPVARRLFVFPYEAEGNGGFKGDIVENRVTN